MYDQWHNKINSEFFTDNLFDGSKVKEKMIVHEYAKKRWGVFEEHGFPGDPHFPLLYNVCNCFLYSQAQAQTLAGQV